MKSQSIHTKKRYQRNKVLALYTLGVTLFMAVYTTYTVVQYL